MNRRFAAATAALASAALLLSACGDDAPETAPGATTEESTGATDTASTGTEPQGELTLAGWSLSSTPEFQTLADGFNATNPDYTVTVKEYDAQNYDTQMIADLAAGTAPDLYILKNLLHFHTYASGEQLLDVSDVAGDLGDNPSVSFYEYEGATYAVPYRQDGWLLYYNKDLFAAAGVDEPDATWTWDDYAETAKELTTALEGSDSPAKGAYHHSWQSIIQGFANGQSPDADILTGEFDHLKPYYQRALDLQEAGAIQDFGAVSTNQLTYQSQFGTQEAAMLPMGSWYIATLLAQQESGDAEDFEWGIAPAPQFDESTTGMDNVPVTFGDPTGIGINPAIEEGKLDAAKDFLRYVASEDGSKALAEIGITPSVMSDSVTSTFFGLDGMPTDELSQWAFQTREIRPENPVSEHTAPIQTVLNETHSAVLSGSVGAEEGFDQAEERVKGEILGQ